MSFAFCFDREDDVYQFAYCYPYTYSRLQHYLTSLEQRNLDYLKREQLGLSVQQRRLDLLTITNPDSSRSIWVMAASAIRAQRETDGGVWENAVPICLKYLAALIRFD
ncbi:hypothetical protein MHYP_G00324680 [Metynnis hypsauchen]